MTETDEKPEEKNPAKQGLHGWKAALAMFGCGSLAAFSIFGVLTLLVTSIFDFTSSGVQGSGGTEGAVPEGIGEARSSLEEEEMNVCDDNLDELTKINVERQDEGENYLDTRSEDEIEIPGATRVVQDECSWVLQPSSGSSPWVFHFSYEAAIESDGKDSTEDLASERFEQLSGDLSEGLGYVSSQGVPGFDDGAQYVYGENEDGEQSYIVMLQSKSAVYSIHFERQEEDSIGEVTKNEFEGEAREIASFLDSGFDYWIPDS
ncbi:hypothetical protein [Nocardiopsis xinjiangensis]|uniref:hypothetical protein n=1 Tax=Nocardiopsis xinjiangensis TaxID=124285 RepID=UPI00126811F9